MHLGTWFAVTHRYILMKEGQKTTKLFNKKIYVINQVKSIRRSIVTTTYSNMCTIYVIF